MHGKAKKMSSDQWFNFKDRATVQINKLKENIQLDIIKEKFEPNPRAPGVCEYCPARIHCRFELRAKDEQ